MAGAIESLAIVAPFYPPHLGGVERHAQEFARAATSFGVRVNVVTTARVSRPTEVVEDEGIRVLRLPAHDLPIMGSHFPITLAGWSKAEALLDCDLVLAHTRFFLTTLLAARTVARRGRQICVLDHGSGPLRTSPRAMAMASLMYERISTALLKRLSTRFFAISAASATWLREFGINDATIVPNGIAQRSPMPLRDVANFRDPQVFFAGRLLLEKGVCQLVEAIDSMVRGGSSIRLRIAGDGPLADFLRQRAASSSFLTYLGRLSPAQVSDELDRATVFINPSNYAEGLPTILLEAGAAALPVISTPRGGSTDLIREPETGWLIGKGEPREIAKRLGEVLSQPAEAVRRGAALFRLVQSNYTWPSVVRAFLTLDHGARDKPRRD